MIGHVRATPDFQPRRFERNWLKRFGYGWLCLCSLLNVLTVWGNVDAVAEGEWIAVSAFFAVLLGIVSLVLGLIWMYVLWSKASRLLISLCLLFWLGLTGACFATPVTFWPMRLTFTLYRAQFEGLADRLQRGDIPKQPFRLGIYTIRLAEVNDNGIVCLWIQNEEPKQHRLYQTAMRLWR